MFRIALKIFKTSLLFLWLCLLCGCYYLYPHDEPLPDSYFQNNNKNQNYQQPTTQQYKAPYQPNPAPNQYYVPANQVNHQQQYGYQPIYTTQPIYYPYQYYQGGSIIYTNPYVIPQPILQQLPQIQDQDQYYKIPNNTQFFDTNR